MPVTLYTVGHSTRSLLELLELLHEAGIEALVDVRRYPGSRRHPHFGRDALRAEIERSGLRYRHEPDLGGRREPATDSKNEGLRHPAFRGYADHMASREFLAALARLLEQAATQKTVILCAEALPQRCHRRLIADAAVLGGAKVVHLLSAGRSELHHPHPAARLEDGVVVYPGTQLSIPGAEP
jgi:uncharacterized protein (DUF488 family)